MAHTFTYQAPFGVSPHFVDSIPKLKERELQVLLALACVMQGTGSNTVGQIELGEYAGLGERAAQRALKGLEKKGLISVCKRWDRRRVPMKSQYQISSLFRISQLGS